MGRKKKKDLSVTDGTHSITINAADLDKYSDMIETTSLSDTSRTYISSLGDRYYSGTSLTGTPYTISTSTSDGHLVYYPPSDLTWDTTASTVSMPSWKDYPDLMRTLEPEYDKVKTTSNEEPTPDGKAHMIVCRDRDNLSVENILKNLHVIKGKLMIDIAPIKVRNIECYMTPDVRRNIILASKKLTMYGKKKPIIARFDDYGRQLPDEITIDTSEGITLKIVDPEDYGPYYLALRAIEFPLTTGGFTFDPDEDLPF